MYYLNETKICYNRDIGQNWMSGSWQIRRRKKMKVTIAIDSLKGSLSSLEAGDAIGQGVKKAWPEAEVCVRPLADGGEGTVEAVVSAMGGKNVTLSVTGPLGTPVRLRRD